MLFLHGLPDFWYSWRYQMHEFSKDYWTVALDLPGFGPNLVVKPCPLMSNERSSTNELPDTTEREASQI